MPETCIRDITNKPFEKLQSCSILLLTLRITRTVLFHPSTETHTNGPTVHPTTIRGCLQRLSGNFYVRHDTSGATIRQPFTNPTLAKVASTRHAAEQILTSFRQTAAILPACQYILGESFWEEERGEGWFQ
ncbi:hypothetical protein BC937DRAFT_89166 [Endogone sp. FLAS-F59071]|nr:hypothetical protein BC937DRAFT_89166 [Endogone sp. FLAS-F59071]|eukprot:RUS18082.1 hypothetical protein BC937DRAFT_89166 [Endogone sp. FLAS-F59071]